MIEILSMERYNLSPRSPMYNKDYEFKQEYIDLETHERVTWLKARLDDTGTYDKYIRRPV